MIGFGPNMKNQYRTKDTGFKTNVKCLTKMIKQQYRCLILEIVISTFWDSCLLRDHCRLTSEMRQDGIFSTFLSQSTSLQLPEE